MCSFLGSHRRTRDLLALDPALVCTRWVGGKPGDARGRGPFRRTPLPTSGPGLPDGYSGRGLVLLGLLPLWCGPRPTPVSLCSPLAVLVLP